LETGRTHQIRVHMSYIGHPLLGDQLYGGSIKKIKRVALHSAKVSFIHPVTKEEIKLIKEMPFDMKNLVR
ncbi:MAG: RNA pseudouridine synthase, partial [Acholeplasmatales bacterium]|nr:RNA pseudouridine synthase [Acholeplasmatales bacterium]